ncbi:hypothetical protein M3204_14035 [Mesobacillus subterraneus]|uniref:hypothetical protein n=1 Tax=Mesobacillus subterraneus TaxID=285983 RepID=UPI00203E81C6|nr:hypothetical protein [Mesobacillus subterraneus]MCM3665533.1 hypothetical protein [Mesobacillus subterraneus]MCM3686092.1 hypothetical protein [Mesobacillus subterraneus]
MSGKLHLGREKQVHLNLNKAQVTQLDNIRREYGMSMSDAIKMLIRQEALRLSKKEIR